MAKTTANGQIQRRAQGPDLARFLMEDLGPQIRVALPKHLDGDRMARVALTALRTTPKLAECDRYSFAACILSAAQLGLEVNTPLGHAYLIPRKNECTLMIGYQGMIDLARRSGQVSTIYAHTVHAGDAFHYELGLDPKLTHVPADDDSPRTEATMRFVYAVAALKDGERQFVVLPMREVLQRKARGAGGPAWRTDFIAMAKKTAIRALFTWIPKSPEMARAAAFDDVAEGARSSAASLLDPSVAAAIEVVGEVLPDEPSEEEQLAAALGTGHNPSTGEVSADEEARMAGEDR